MPRLGWVPLSTSMVPSAHLRMIIICGSFERYVSNILLGQPLPGSHSLCDEVPTTWPGTQVPQGKPLLPGPASSTHIPLLMLTLQPPELRGEGG